jgi:hypothetical protein
VVGHHVTGEADTETRAAVAEIAVSRLAAKVVGDGVVVERVSAGDGVGVAAKALDGLGGAA